MCFFIPDKITFVLETLNKAGFSASIVGGCVRDVLMGGVPHDYDVTTSALPGQVRDLFEKTADTGIKHGTVTVISGGEPVEVTTYRVDGEYTDCRRPDSVLFVPDIRSDLSRRDFTVNAMAYNQNDGLIDYFGGRNDLSRHILRAVGEPERRFGEDALRIMRLFRFSSVLGFSAEEKTLTAALECSPLLENVSAERIMSELTKAVCGKNPDALTPLLNRGGLLFAGIGGCESLGALTGLADKPYLRLFAMLTLCGCDCGAVLSRLKADNRIKAACRTLEELFSGKTPENRAEIKNLLNLSGEEIFRDYISLLSVLRGENTEYPERETRDIIRSREPYRLRDLAIRGGELKQIGISGEETGKALEFLRLAVVGNPALNERETLLRLARNLHNELS